MERPIEINSESKTCSGLNSLVAISVALLAAFMAVTKVKDDHILLGLKLHTDWLTKLLS